MSEAEGPGDSGRPSAAPSFWSPGVGRSLLLLEGVGLLLKLSSFICFKILLPPCGPQTSPGAVGATGPH